MRTLLALTLWPCISLAAPIKVMVIDTAFYSHPMVTHKVLRAKQAANSKHSLLTIHTLTTNPNKLCPQVEIHLCLESDSIFAWEVAGCINKAIDHGIKFMLIPYEGTPNAFAVERRAFERAYRNNLRIVISAGNSSLDLDKKTIFPQSYAKQFSNVSVISANDLSVASKGSWTVNNISGKITVLGRDYFGTSFAAPKYLNKLLNQECRRVNGVSR